MECIPCILPLNTVILILSFIKFECLIHLPFTSSYYNFGDFLLSFFLTLRNTISQLFHSTVFILKGPFRCQSGTQSVTTQIFRIPSKTLQKITRYFSVYYIAPSFQIPFYSSLLHHTSYHQRYRA